MAFEALPMLFPYKISKTVPANPNTIPKAFHLRIFSFMMMADNTKTIIGVVTMITEAIIGEVRLNPSKNVSILRATPKKAEAIILGKSFNAIFSALIKSATSQNKRAEPPTLKTINPKGFTNSGITSLAIVNVTP
ncbi:hypothetical protein D9M72_408970 [compost metagenome]